MQQRCFLGTLAFGPAASRTTTCLSSGGYVDVATGTKYLPILASLPDVDRELDISISGSSMTQSFGQLTVNLSDGVADSMNVRNHTGDLSILTGLRSYDMARGWWSDPALSACQPLFTGSATAWRTGATQGTLTLSGPAVLSRQLPLATYAGTGGVEGGSDLTGRVKPRLRGHAFNITPVCVDSVNQIYQVSDAPFWMGTQGTQPDLTVLEGGVLGSWSATSTDGSWSYAGMVSDITTADPAAGTYVVESSSRGAFFRLGGTPVYTMTCWATGLMPDGTYVSSLPDIVRQVLVQDIGIPAASISSTWADPFGTVDSAAGAFWDGSDSYTGNDMITALLQGTMRKLAVARDGTLKLIGITDSFLQLAPHQWEKLAVLPDEVIDIKETDLPSELALPLTCGRCTYSRNYTVMSTSTLSPKADLSTLRTQRSAVTVGMDNPTVEVVSPPEVLTSLRTQAGAQVVADVINKLWTVADRRVFYVTLPFERLFDFEMGDEIVLFANVDGLRDGLGGLVVGESWRGSSAGQCVLTVLV